MSDLDEIEMDYTRFHNGMCGLEELKAMREKYDGKRITKEIDKRIKEIQNDRWSKRMSKRISKRILQK